MAKQEHQSLHPFLSERRTQLNTAIQIPMLKSVAHQQIVIIKHMWIAG